VSIVFPDPVVVGQVLIVGDTTYSYDGVGWRILGTSGGAGAGTLSPSTAETLTYDVAGAQTDFVLSTPDRFGGTYALATSAPLEELAVWLNGSRLSLDDGSGTLGDFTVDYVANTVELVAAAQAGDVVQIDVYLPPELLTRGNVDVVPVLDLDIDWAGAQAPGQIDGSRTTFPLYFDDNGTPTLFIPSSAAELAIYVDGIRQRPIIDYTVNMSDLTFLTAPRADAAVWAQWFRSVPAASSGSGEGVVLIDTSQPAGSFPLGALWYNPSTTPPELSVLTQTAPSVVWTRIVDDRFLLRDGSLAMTGDLDLATFSIMASPASPGDLVFDGGGGEVDNVVLDGGTF